MDGFEDWASDDSAFDATDKVADETSGGDYLKFDDGDSKLIVFKGAPVAYKQVWMGDHSEIYDEDKHDGMKPSGRFMFAVAVYLGEGKGYKPALFETSATTYNTIRKSLKKKGAKHVWEIEREGTGTKTTYTCVHERALEGKELEHVAGLTLLDAQASVDTKAAADGGGSEPTDIPKASNPFGDEDIPF